MTLPELKAHHLAEAARFNAAADYWSSLDPTKTSPDVIAHMTAPCVEAARFHLDAAALLDLAINGG